MARNQQSRNTQPPKPESPAMVERKKDATAIFIFFLAIVAIAALGCAVYEHMSYAQEKSRDNTESADDLNGQSPANTTASTSAATPAPAGAAPAASGSAPATGNAPSSAASGAAGGVAASQSSQKPADTDGASHGSATGPSAPAGGGASGQAVGANTSGSANPAQGGTSKSQQ